MDVSNKNTMFNLFLPRISDVAGTLVIKSSHDLVDTHDQVAEPPFWRVQIQAQDSILPSSRWVCPSASLGNRKDGSEDSRNPSPTRKRVCIPLFQEALPDQCDSAWYLICSFLFMFHTMMLSQQSFIASVLMSQTEPYCVCMMSPAQHVLWLAVCSTWAQWVIP